MQPYGYGRAWRALGVTAILLGIAFPVLMLLNHEVLDLQSIVICGIFVALGVWCYAYFSKYAIALDEDGFTLYRFAKPPMKVAWRDVITVSSGTDELVLRTNDHRTIKISIHFPGYAAIEAAAASHLADASYGGAPKPYVEAPTTDPEVLTARYIARRRFFIAMSRRSLYLSLGLCAAAWCASFILERADFRTLAKPLRIVAVYILAFAKGWGYGMSACFALIAFLLFVMFLQEIDRHRKGLPPAA